MVCDRLNVCSRLREVRRKMIEVCEALIANGRAAETPVALIEKGTRPDQRVFVGDLTSIYDQVVREDVHAPTLFIVGEVVKLRQ